MFVVFLGMFVSFLDMFVAFLGMFVAFLGMLVAFLGMFVLNIFSGYSQGISHLMCRFLKGFKAPMSDVLLKCYSDTQST